MATFKTFEEIDAWKKARELTKRVYAVTRAGAFAKDFSLKDQIRRASVSIMSNVAEGFDRGGTGEFVQFLAIAKGSTVEVKSQLYVALDQDYIDQRIFAELSGLTMETGSMVGGLMKYLRWLRYQGHEIQNSIANVLNSRKDGIRTRNSKLETRNWNAPS
jgi:four helix bundle protein